jgi:uncharacterized protein YaeQ
MRVGERGKETEQEMEREREREKIERIKRHCQNNSDQVLMFKYEKVSLRFWRNDIPNRVNFFTVA